MYIKYYFQSGFFIMGFGIIGEFVFMFGRTHSMAPFLSPRLAQTYRARNRVIFVRNAGGLLSCPAHYYFDVLYNQRVTTPYVLPSKRRVLRTTNIAAEPGRRPRDIMRHSLVSIHVARARISPVSYMTRHARTHTI